MLLRSIKMAGTPTERENREKLLKTVKKEVKQIMEEAVTRKFVHEGSSSVTSLCAAVEACLSHGLRRRALGLFKTNSTTALLHKVAKHYDPAATISALVEEVENADLNKTSSTSGDSTSKSLKKAPPTTSQPPQFVVRYLWIRLALFEKQLARIIDHLVQNSSKYYDKDALVADPVDGPILASLLVGPCALDYSKMKTQDHLWTDLPADELVQRHRISGAYHPSPSTPPTCRRLGLHFKKPMSSGNSGCGGTSFEELTGSTHRASSILLPLTARDYVELLHQNSKATLLYGKNNVMVQPKESVGPIAGYLSLHQTADLLAIKWTPNQLMNGCCEDKSEDQPSATIRDDKSVFWEYALNVNISEIVYVHCHQQADSGGTIVMVGQDGVQRPPIHFPKGGHLLAFLSCLENGLLPHGQLDPPLWSQRGRGKVFPKLRRKGTKGSPAKSRESAESASPPPDDDEETSDYVFRIISSIKPDAISQEMMDPKTTPRSGGLAYTAAQWASYVTQRERSSAGGGGGGGHRRSAPSGSSTRSSSSNSSGKSLSLTEEYAELQRQNNCGAISEEVAAGRDSLQLLCDTMKRQIISRAFYGWMAHCRHLRTVRTHLSGLVNTTIVSIADPADASQGLTESVWKEVCREDTTISAMEVYRLVYFGGIQSEIRKEVWPYLLGHYEFGSGESERQSHDEFVQQQYETTMSEWLAVEAIVRQRDKEIVAAQLAKLSSESTNGEIPLVGKDHTLINEVFEDSCSDGSLGSRGREGGDDDDNDDDDDDDDDDDGKPMTGHRIVADTVTPDEGMAEDEDDELIDAAKKADDLNVGSAMPLLDSGTLSEGSHEIAAINDATPLSSSGNLAASTNFPVSAASAGEEGVEEKDVDEGQTDESGILEASRRDSRVTCLSPTSSSGGVYSMELLDSFALNLHRIDKDVQRCDRNYWYFTASNLEKLRNVMCTYVWEHLDIGYVQGMCDLVAPLLVIFDDEPKSYSCFCELMKRMSANFPHGGAMDSHFANMRSLIQILDAEMFELMHQNGDYTHFYFCYRWFLLDFKRELVYDDVFCVWETIWAAKYVASNHFVLFIALALVEYYRDVILDNNMDFTDVIKFFNEMAEHHNAKSILKVARELVLQLQTLIDNK